jgi:hypothetical protein
MLQRRNITSRTTATANLSRARMEDLEPASANSRQAFSKGSMKHLSQT